MANELDPVVDQWYWHKGKGPLFYVAAIDDDERTIEVQHFDGDLEEITFQEWRAMADLEVGEAPENWSGSLDVGATDDYGDEITDTANSEWDEPLTQYRRVPGSTNDEGAESGTTDDDYGEGYMEETPLENQDQDIPAPDPSDLPNVTEREDGVFEEVFDASWYAEYSMDPDSGLWRVDLFKHDVPEWRQDDFDSLEEASAAANDYFAQA